MGSFPRVRAAYRSELVLQLKAFSAGETFLQVRCPCEICSQVRAFSHARWEPPAGQRFPSVRVCSRSELHWQVKTFPDGESFPPGKSAPSKSSSSQVRSTTRTAFPQVRASPSKTPSPQISYSQGRSSPLFRWEPLGRSEILPRTEFIWLVKTFLSGESFHPGEIALRSPIPW